MDICVQEDARPYKDLDKRRTYEREYNRWQRARERLSNLCQTPVRKAYLCPRAPYLRLPGIAFQNGLFVTDRPEGQKWIEEDTSYATHIFS